MPSIVSNVFKSLPVVHEVHAFDARPATAAFFGQDTISLGWEERLKVRGRRVTAGGVEFATALPRGTVLHDGDCLIIDPMRLTVRVVERAEAVFVIRPASAAEGALFAYHIGNSHQPIMLVDGLIVCPDVPGMSQLLDYHGIPFEATERPFTPVGQTSNHQHEVAR